MIQLGTADVALSSDDPRASVAVFKAARPLLPTEQLMAGRALYEEGRRLICEPLAAAIERFVREMKAEKVEVRGRSREMAEGWNRLDVKQALVKQINEIIRRYDLGFRSPDGGGPCTLVAINDLWGGKVAYENRATKKRSGTKRHIEDLFPLTLMPAPIPPTKLEFEVG